MFNFFRVTVSWSHQAVGERCLWLWCSDLHTNRPAQQGSQQKFHRKGGCIECLFFKSFTKNQLTDPRLQIIYRLTGFCDLPIYSHIAIPARSPLKSRLYRDLIILSSMERSNLSRRSHVTTDCEFIMFASWNTGSHKFLILPNIVWSLPIFMRNAGCAWNCFNGYENP